MSHVMGHEDVTYTKGKIRDAQAEFAEYIEEYMMESGNDSGGVYDTKTTWHPDLVYDTWKEACDAVDKMAGFYHCHAVLYHDMDVDYDEVDATPSVKKLKERWQAARKHADELERASDIHNRKSDSISCAHCSSRISLAYCKTKYDCPVCGYDLRCPSVLARIGKADDKAARLHEAFLEEQGKIVKKLTKNAPLRWCVAYDFHC